jgi:hypothetical protein
VTVVQAFALDGRHLPIVECRRSWLNQCTQLSVASSRSARTRQARRGGRARSPDGALGQGAVIAVTDRADRGQRAGIEQPVSVADRSVLPRFNRSTQHAHLQRE